MLGDGAEDRTERSESEGIVVWNRDPVVSRLGRFQDDVAADLVHSRVLPFPAQEVSEARAARLTGMTAVSSLSGGDRARPFKYEYEQQREGARSLAPSHMLDYVIAELRALDLRRAFH